jgi:hypothetical protein
MGVDMTFDYEPETVLDSWLVVLFDSQVKVSNAACLKDRACSRRSGKNFETSSRSSASTAIGS